MITVKFTGVKEIDDVLKNMPKALTHAVMSAAHANAAKPLVNKMQLLAPEGPTGNLVDSIGIIKSSAKKATEIGEIKVGPRRNRKGRHAHFPEYGTKKRRTRGGANRGVMPIKKYALPAYEQTKDQVLKGIATSTAKVLIRTMKKYT
jgi:HK97 gp10 family phage protein